MPRLWTGTVWQGVPVVLYDLVRGLNGANITQGSVSNLFARVFYDSSGEQIGSDIALVKTECIFDTLQDATDDPRYTGTGGFNFRATIPGLYFRPLPDSGDDDALITVFVFFADASSPPITSVSGWQIIAKEVFGFP